MERQSSSIHPPRKTRGAMGMKRRRPEESGRWRSATIILCVGCLSSSWSPTEAFVSNRPSFHSRQQLPQNDGGSLQYSLGVERPLVTPLELETLKHHQHQHHLSAVPSFAPLPTIDSLHVEEDTRQSTATATSDIVPGSVSTPRTIARPQSVSKPLSKNSHNNNILQLWKRRLITREDWKHTHKITGVLFLLSSWALTAYALRDLVANGWTIPVTRHGRPFQWCLWTLIASSVAQSFSSVSMACRYRRGQPAIRNTFLCNAAVAILGSVSALWTSTWYPASLNGIASKAFYLTMDAIGLMGMADNLVRLKALIASRQQHKNATQTMTPWQYWKDVFVYMMPILIGAPFFVAIGWQFGIQQDRLFYLNLLQQPGHLHLKGGAVYAMIMVAMGASYSSLIVTLRDKKLIGKKTEGWSLTAVMLCLIGSLYQAMRDPGTIPLIMGM